MAFCSNYEEKISKFFWDNKSTLITPSDFFFHLKKKMPHKLGKTTLPKPFFHFLEMYGFNGKSQSSLLSFLRNCCYSLIELKLKFLQEWISIIYRRNQKNNHQIFFYQLLLKWCGCSIEGMDFLQQTHNRMSTSTFFQKYCAFSKQCEKDNFERLKGKNFVTWFDNFTKIFSRDYTFQQDGKSYTMYDLTVVCALLLPSPPLLKVDESSFELQDRLHFGRQVFEAQTSLVFQMPQVNPTEVLYQRYKGN